MAHKGGPSIALMGGGVKSVGINDLDRFLDFLSSEQSGTATRSPEAIYKTVAWAYRCVQLRAWGVSSVPYIICKRTAKAGYGALRQPSAYGASTTFSRHRTPPAW
jgi:hypothetical protein